MVRRLSDATALRLARIAEEIRGNPPQGEHITYLPKSLVQTNLPLRRPTGTVSWVRVNGDCRLTLHPPLDGHGNPMFPYGMMPRLILAWITTQVVRKEARTLSLGPCLTSFLKDIGLSPDNGSLNSKRSDARRLWYQLNALLRSVIVMEHFGRAEVAWKVVEVSSSGKIWGKEGGDVSGQILLGEGFFRECAQAIPMDLRVLQAVRRQPMAIDVYAWTTYRVWGLLNSGNHETTIAWRTLEAQFGANFTSAADFRNAFIGAISRVAVLYEGFDFSLLPGRIRLQAHYPSVGPRLVDKRGYQR